MKTNQKHLFSLLTLLIAFCLNTYAGEVPAASKRIGGKGAPKVVRGQASAKDSIQLSGVPTDYSVTHTDKKLINVLSFGMDYLDTKFPLSAKKVKVKVRLKGYNQNNALLRDSSFFMDIKYNPEDTAKEISRTTFIQGNSYKLVFSVDSIFVDGSSQDTLPSYVFLEASISADRLFNFETIVNNQIIINPIDTLDIDCDVNGISDELLISWPALAGAEEYQLEWTFINDYSIDANGQISFISPSNLQYSFKNNSTRISTTNNFYKIPILFERGYVLFRVRALGYNAANPPVLLTGVWSDVTIGNVDNALSSYYIWNPHEQNKNWQLSTTFAEEGKKKEVISYFDGSQRNRQTVTKINSDNNVIVGETIYDYQGRPAISVLPTPVVDPNCEYVESGPTIKFYDEYNRNLSEKRYTKEDFDKDAADNCSNATFGMSTSSGSSNYYSGANLNKNAQQAFVPDANKFPFSQVEYTPDNTGRIARQSGVGTTFQLNSGHETQYFYGQPNQIQLDRLFGSEVGDATHYKKNLVVDANGQVSVTYLDQEGRTIATSLASNSPLNLLPIASEQNAAISTSVDLFNKNALGISNLNTIDQSINAIQFNSQLLVSSVSNYTFTYDLQIDPVYDSCLAAGICFSCIYDLEIKVLDKCNFDLAASGSGNTSTPYKKMVGHFTPASETQPITFTTLCSETTSSSSEHLSFTIDNMQVGAYQVIKTLTLNEDAIDFYVQAYLDSTLNTCFKTLDDFIEGAVDSIDFSGCNLTCETCLEQLGTRDDYISRGEGTAADYERDYQECKDLCPSPVDPCEVAYESMLGDMSPEGQYGQTQDYLGNFNVSVNTLSVFNPNNHLPVHQNDLQTNPQSVEGTWKRPKLTIDGVLYDHYLNNDNSFSKIILTPDPNNPGEYIPEVEDNDQNPNNINGNIHIDPLTNDAYAYPHQLKYEEDFVANWNTNWAKSLLIYHPEYFYYTDCISYKTKCDNEDPLSSAGFDSLLLMTNTFADALSKGLILTDGVNYTVDHWINRTTNNNGTPGNTADDTYYPFDPMTNCSLYGNYSQQLVNKFISYSNGSFNGTTYSYSMKEVSAMSARCGTLVNALPPAYCTAFGTDLHPNTVPNYQTLNTQVRDNEWMSLKAYYTSEKQKLQINRADQLAIANDAVNDCIGNAANYSPAASGMFTSTNGNFPYYDPAQPCSYQNMAYYANKQQRFPDPAESLAGGQTQAAYQSYMQSGQCPNTISLQSLLSELAGNNNLSNTNLNLAAIPSYNSLLMTVTNNTPATLTLPTIWSATNITSSSIQFSINDQNNQALSNCIGTLSTQNTNFSGWNNIQNFFGLLPSGGANGVFNFTVKAYVSIPSTTGGAPTLELMDFTGTTCINIQTCNFPLSCELTPVTRDIITVMNTLANSNNGANFTSSTPVSITQYTTQAIINTLGSSSGANITWQQISSTEYVIANSTNSKTIRLTFQGSLPAFPQTYIDPVSNGQNTLDLTIQFSNGAGTTSTQGIVFEILTNGASPQPLITAICDRPEPFYCAQEGHITKNDFEKLIKDVLLNQAPNAINLFASAYMNNNLISYTTPANAGSANVTTSTYAIAPVTTGTITTGYKGQLTINGAGCSISIYHLETSNPVLDLNNLVSLGDLTATGNADAQGNLHDFEIPAVFNVNGQNVSATLYGTSCLPLLNCVPCPQIEPVTTVASRINDASQIASASETCAILYDMYLQNINELNAENDPTCTDLVPISYADYQANGYCCNANAYTVAESFIDYTSPCPNNIPLLSGTPDADCDPNFNIESFACQDIFRYIGNLYEASAYYAATQLPISNSGPFYAMPRVNLNYCQCVSAYYTYIQPYLVSNYNPSLPPITPIEQFSDCVNATNPCIAAHADYVTFIQTAIVHIQTIYPTFTYTALTYQQFVDGGFCNCSSYNQFIKLLNKISDGIYDNYSEAQFMQLLSIENACSADPCFNVYNSYLNSLGEAITFIQTNLSAPNFSVTPVSQSQFDAAKLCECGFPQFQSNVDAIIAGNYNNYTLDQLGILLNISILCTNPPVDPCTEAYETYTSAIITTNPLPLLSLEQFVSGGYCNCLPQYLALANAISNGNYGVLTAQEIYTLLDITTICSPPPPPPNCTNPPYSPSVFNIPVPPSNPCEQGLYNNAYANAQAAYETYVRNLTNHIRNKYIAHCLKPFESFYAQYTEKEYHFTLYYYDQAGNLIKTIPPEGVRPLTVGSYPTTYAQGTPEYVAQQNKIKIDNDRTYKTRSIFTNHLMATTYEYNSLNQLVRQYMPDHDPMDIFDITLANGLDERLQTTAIQMVNENRGYLSGFVPVTTAMGTQRNRGYLYTTYDGGKTWQKITGLTGGDLKKVFMLNGSSVGYAVGTDGIVLKTEDNGSSWDLLYTFAPNQTVKQLNDLYFINDNEGVIVGNGNRILVTTDGGNSFTEQTLSTTEQSNNDSIDIVSASYIANEGTIVLLANITLQGEKRAAIFRSNNLNNSLNTLTWNREINFTQNTLNDVNYFNQDSAYAVGVDGILLRTYNNGDNWQTINSGITKNINKVYFKTKNEGIALIDSVQGYQQIYITHNGGYNWELFSKPGNYYNDIYEYYHRPYGLQNAYGSKLVAVGKKGLIQKIILQNGTPGGFVDLQKPASMLPGTEITSVWASYNQNGNVYIVIGSVDGNIYKTIDYGTPTLSWATNNGLPNVYVKQIRAYKPYAQNSSNMRGVALLSDGNIAEIGFNQQNNQFDVNPIPVLPSLPQQIGADFRSLAIDTLIGDVEVYALDNTAGNNRIREVSLPLTYSVTITNTQVYAAISNNNGLNGIAYNNGNFIFVGQDGQIITRASGSGSPFIDATEHVNPGTLNDINSTGFGTFAAGNDGAMLKRTGQGINAVWNYIITNSNSQFNVIQNHSSGEVIVAGNNGIILGGAISGANYLGNVKNSSTSENINDLVIDPALGHVFAAANNGKLLYNSNYFNTNSVFVSITNPFNTTNFEGIALNSQNLLIGVGTNNMLVQSNGISASRIKTLYTPQLNDVHFADANNGHVIGANLTIRKTNNGGNSFTVIIPDNQNPNTANQSSVPTSVANTTLTKVWTIDYNNALVVADNESYYAIVNNNKIQQQNPSAISSGAGTNFYSLTFASGNNQLSGYAGSNDAAIRKVTLSPVNGTYTVAFDNPVMPLPTNPSAVKDIQILLNNDVVICGENSLFNYYQNNNGTLTETSLPFNGFVVTPNISLNTVYFHDTQFGYVAGSNGTYYKIKIEYQNGLMNKFTFNSRSLADNYNINTASNNITSPEITAMAFANVTNGIWGGNYGSAAYTNINTPYVRNISDESERYSTRFWYDKLGRMVLSQNTKQYEHQGIAQFSYTLYDELGRIKEVGQKNENGPSSTHLQDIFGSMVSSYYNPNTIDDEKFTTWINSESNTTRSEVTRTYYDETHPDVIANLDVAFTQENLRKRVASVTYEDVYDGDDATYEHGTHYSYDIHGNVKTMFNENQKLAKKFPDDVNSTLFAQQKNKRIDYDYDLISGKVNSVAYQNGKQDQWHHAYEYDADNRILEVQTSTDNILWQKDAKYLYYHHGPLARTELGENLVQGVDYVYTLQGWIKGVNSNSLSSQSDPGMDNFGMNTTSPSLNQNFAKDVYGYTLGYFDGDYQPIDMIKWNTTNRFEADKTGSQLLANRNNLYNGNIGSMVTTIVDPNNPSVPLPLGSAYKYDQLNRILLGTSYNNLNLTTNTWGGGGTIASNLYRNEFVYDANGNILNQKRYNNFGQMFDNLEYKYDYAAYSQPIGADGGTDMRRNRLYHVNDQIGLESLETDDIDDMGSLDVSLQGFTWGANTNYDYTPIGELKKDTKEGIENIEWTVYGKIKEVTRHTAHGMQTLKFDYDASGNRIAKHVYSATGTWKKSTYYSRDAQGNVMSVYEQFFNPTIAAGSYAQVEKHIYGSSRLGMEKTFVELIDNNGPGPDPNNLNTARLMIIDAPGARVYELTNHLGNVLATITDRKIPVGDMNDNIIGYNAELYTANDYSAFGAPLKGRKFDKTVCVPQTIITPLVNEDFNGTNTAGFTGINNALITIAGNRLRANKPQNTLFSTFGMQKTFSVAANSDYILTFDLGVMSSPPVTVRIVNTANGQVIQTQSYNADAFVSLNFSTSIAGTYRLELTANSGTNPNPKRMFNIDNLFIEETNNTPLCVNYGSYRQGFNGKEKDDETYGDGNEYDYGFRIYDPRLGRFFSIDPLTQQYPWYTPYQFAGNSPIRNLDLDGKEELDYTTYQQGMINAAAKLNNAPFPNDIGGGHWVFTIDKNNAFFTTDGKGFILKPGKKPSEGIKEILQNPKNYSMDCGTYVQVTKLAGMLNSMGDDEFDKYYTPDEKGNYEFKIMNHASTGVNYADLYMSVGGGYVQGSKGIFKADKLIKKVDIGTEITLSTPALAGTKHDAYKYENIIKVGKDSYLAQGLGTGPMTMKQVTEALNNKAKEITGQEKNDVYIKQVKTSAAKIKE